MGEFIVVCSIIVFVIYKIQKGKKQKLIEQQKQEELELKKKQQEEARRQREEQRKQHIIKCKNDFLNISNGINRINIEIKESLYKKRNLCDMPEITFSTIRKNSNYRDISNFIAVDVETTGLQPKRDDIIEISAVKFIDGEPIECMSTLINPKKAIPTDVTEINNITNEMVKDSPSISNVIDSFSDFIKGFNIVGYNLEFDLNFLFINNLDLFSEKRKFYDLLPICRRHISKDYVCNYKLNTVCEYYNIYRDDAHRSMSDALATGLLFSNIAKEIKNTIYDV